MSADVHRACYFLSMLLVSYIKEHPRDAGSLFLCDSILEGYRVLFPDFTRVCNVQCMVVMRLSWCRSFHFCTFVAGAAKLGIACIRMCGMWYSHAGQREATLGQPQKKGR